MKVIYTFLFLFISLPLFSQKTIQNLKDGDLIFQNGECGSLCQSINTVTPAILGKHYSHVGIIKEENQQLFVIEAIGTEVQKNILEIFLARNSEPVIIGRLQKQYKHLIPKALEFSEQQIGIPYDDEFLYDNGKYYCSELIYDAFKEANQGQDIFVLEPMTFKAPGSQVYFSGWVDYYRKLGLEIPEGQPGCNPGSLGQSDKITLYFYKPHKTP